MSMDRALVGANHFKDLLAGTLVDSAVRVKLWRVPREEIPQSMSERTLWLAQQWQDVDDWIEASQTE